MGDEGMFTQVLGRISAPVVLRNHAEAGRTAVGGIELAKFKKHSNDNLTHKHLKIKIHDYTFLQKKQNHHKLNSIRSSILYCSGNIYPFIKTVGVVLNLHCLIQF